MEPQLNDRLTKLEQKIDEIYAVVLKTRKAQKSAAMVRTLYWVFIILLGFGSFYFIQPFLSQLKDTYGFGNSSDSQNVQELMNQINGLKEQ